MSSFSLPRVPMARPGLEPVLRPKLSDSSQSPSMVNPTLQGYLHRVKAEIDTRQEDWDRYKKYTNPCEYVHTPVPGGKQAVCRLRPLSRSFYKMIELLHTCSLCDGLPPGATTFHFAEGPGGFMEALAYQREHAPEDRYYGMTLVCDSDPAVPGWKKSRTFLNRHPNVTTLTGVDGTGDLFSPENLRACRDAHAGCADLVTGDGGFDFSMDFNRQEAASTRLILAQIMFALAVQRPGGTFVLKVFDTFTQASLDLLYTLSSLYATVQAVKPATSRQANSEKYLVCKGFHGGPTDELRSCLAKCVADMRGGRHLLRLFAAPLPYHYVTKVEELNAVLGQQQIESIAATLALMDAAKHERLETLRKNNVQKCIGWCQRHRLPYNRSIATTNIFLGSRGELRRADGDSSPRPPPFS
jgi:23S rRNA U2552 (ribose-2'-O)-methylase RlmE/FtsJ